LLVRVEDEAALIIEDVSCGRRERELPLVGFVQLPALKAKAHHMPLGVAHRALHAEHEPIVKVVGIVDSVVVDDERIGDRAKIEETMPVGR
jgi:hypothetical protein